MTTPQHPETSADLAAPPQTAAPVPSPAPAPAPTAVPPAADEPVYTPQPVPEPGLAIPDPNHFIQVALVGRTVRVIPPGAWRQSTMRLLKQGDTDAFVEQVLHPDDWEHYERADPTNDELGEFLSDAGEAGGESLGNGRGSTRSSRTSKRK